MLLKQTQIPPYEEVIRTLENIIPEEMEKHAIPGLAIALVEGERLVWSQGFGATSREEGHPVTADTPFSLQSISKTYTATGFLIAASQGLIELDDPLIKPFPDFKVNSRSGPVETGKITFRHLLSHWAGFTHEAPVGGNYDARPCTFEEHIRSISDTWLKFPVGQRYSYSNLGIDLAGYALQLVSGKPFATYMQEVLFEPLGMFHSSFDQPWIMENHPCARGYIGTYELPPLIIPMIPAGGLFATANDMARFLSFQLAGGVVDGKRLIAQDLLEDMRRPQFAVEGQIGGYGLGIAIVPQFGAILLTHAGGGYGYLALQEWLPEYNLGVVILTNQASYRNLHSTIREIALQGMVDAKVGFISEAQRRRYDARPPILLEDRSLRRFEGNYRGRDFLIPIKMQGEKLMMWENVPLDPVSETEFVSSSGARVTFCLDERGRPTAMQVLDDWGFLHYPLDHSPGDEPGPDKAEWSQYLGIYSLKALKNIFYLAVIVRNGDLYLTSRAQDARLREFAPSLFFTSDGEVVCFGEGTLAWGNIPFVKEYDPFAQVVELTRTDPEDRRLFEESLHSLGEAYRATGERTKSLELFSLNGSLHPHWIPGLKRLAEVYLEMGDKPEAYETVRRILELDPENEFACRMLEKD